MVFSAVVGLCFVLFLNAHSGRQERQADDKSYSFSKDVFPLIVTRCYGEGAMCHAGTSRATVRFTSHKTIKAYKKKILKRIDDERAPMPPTNQTPLRQEELEILKSWIEAGALNN